LGGRCGVVLEDGGKGVTNSDDDDVATEGLDCPCCKNNNKNKQLLSHYNEQLLY
jgi:hypothetical protein